jgi:MFS family permease
MFVQGLIGLVLSPIFGHFIDNASNKPSFLGIALVLTMATYLMLIASQAVAWVTFVLACQGSIAALYQPAISSISLGLVGRPNLAARAARNQMMRHIGMIVAALLPIWIVVARPRGYITFFYVIAGTALSAVFAVLMIKQYEIDNIKARAAVDQEGGVKEKAVERDDYSTTTALLQKKEVRLFLAAVICFHFANAALLPEVALKIDRLNNATGGNSTFTLGNLELPVNGKNSVALGSLLAQIIMVPVAKASGWLAKQPWAGPVRTMLATSIVVPIRAFACASSSDINVLIGLQALDGIGYGSFGVLAILIASDLTVATGRFSMMQGGLVTAVGIGAAASNGVAGILTSKYGFAAMFSVLGCISIVAIMLLMALLCVLPNGRGILSAIAEDDLDTIPLMDMVAVQTTCVSSPQIYRGKSQTSLKYSAGGSI